MMKINVYENEKISDPTTVESHSDAADLAMEWAADRNGSDEGLIEWGNALEGGVCPADSTGEGWPWWRSVDED